MTRPEFERRVSQTLGGRHSIARGAYASSAALENKLPDRFPVLVTAWKPSAVYGCVARLAETEDVRPLCL